MAQPIPDEASLLGIPLEIRHMIFQYASVRKTKPKKVLRYWFEKKEVAETIAEQVANDPNGVPPRAVFQDEYDEDSEPEISPENQDYEDEEDDEDQDDDSTEDEEDEDQDQDEENEENEENVEPEIEDNQQEIDESEDVDEAVISQAVGDEPTQSTVDEPMAESEVEIADTTQSAESHADQDMADIGNEETDAGAVPAPGGVEQNQVGPVDVDETEQTNQVAEGEDDEDTANGNGDDNTTTATATQADISPPPPPPPPPPARVVMPHPKWRHIPKFLRITQCPPPVELFLLSKQISSEAKDWFYKVAVLKIDATASFNHQSFFEEALRQIAESAFSPMENIKKAEVTFVWDTTWIRAESTGFAGAVFPFLLEERAACVVRILQQAPELEQVVIYWHDSADDDGAKSLKAEILEGFILNLQADIKTEDHLIAPDVKPHSRSIAGRRRIEFQNIFDRGCETF